MVWLIAAVIVLFLCFKFPKLGKGIATAFGLLVLLCVGYYINGNIEESASKTRINKNEIELLDLRLTPGYSKESYKLTGKIRNNSKTYTLTGLELKHTVTDLLQDGKAEIVGQSTSSLYEDVPPMQSREIDSSVYFSNIPALKGYLKWDYQIVEMKGK